MPYAQTGGVGRPNCRGPSSDRSSGTGRETLETSREIVLRLLILSGDILRVPLGRQGGDMIDRQLGKVLECL